MTHRVETVMAAAVTTLTNLTTTGANVNRGNAYVIESENTPCLHIEMGPETQVNENAHGSKYWNLEVQVTGTVKANEQYEQTLNTIREEVHIAMRADPTLGLSFVIDTDEGDPDELEIEAEAEKPTAQQTWIWNVKYERSIDDPGA